MHFHVMFKDLGSEFLHQDNAYAHAAASTYLEIDPIEFDFLDHQLFSPDLAQEVFAVLHLINRSQKKLMEDFDDLKYAIRTIV